MAVNVIFTRKTLCRGDFIVTRDLVTKMLGFIEHRNQAATRFQWSYDTAGAA